MATKRPHSPLHQRSSSSSSSSEEQVTEEEASKEEQEKHHLPPNPNLTCQPNHSYSKAQTQSSVSPSTAHAKKKKKKKSTDQKNPSPSNANEQEENRSPNLKPTDHNSEGQAQAQSFLRRSGRKPVTKKSTHDEEDEDEKKQKRVWSEEDEIRILKGLADFTSKGNKINITKFCERNKNSVWLNATYAQVRHKIRKMREKYQINVKKLNNGVNCNSIFSKPHKRILFYLSAKVWGNSDDKIALEHSMREMELIEKSKNEELERKLEKLRVKEMKLFVERWKIIKELSMLILEAYNNSIAS